MMGGDMARGRGLMAARRGPADVPVTPSSSNHARGMFRGDAVPTKVVTPSLPWRRKCCGLTTVVL
jgi:hypothetical protein